MLIAFILATLIFIAIVARLRYLNEDYYILALTKRVKTQDGSPLESKIACIKGKTIFGNNFDIINMTPASLFKFVRQCTRLSKGRNFIFHFLMAPVYNIVRAEDAEEVFQSTKLITKNVLYELLKPFLGDGLLLSTDKKWHSRRKTLTPAFHFNVLHSFLEIFKEESIKFIKVLSQVKDNPLVLNQVIPQFTLNNVCETALGVKLDDLAEGARYRKAIHGIETVLVQRTCNPLMYYNWYFFIFGEFKKTQLNLKIAHNFSSSIIERKRQLFKQQQLQDIPTNEFGPKKRYAMLDTLLIAEAEGQIDHQGICEEVDTFMFEGYDTTSTCLSFTILMLALHEDVQQRCLNEIQQLGNMETLTVFDFNGLDYLECVIKESLRLFPPVPFVGRKCTEESVVNGLIMPKDTQISIHIFDIMRDERMFPNPSKFDPDRFLPENTDGRNAFAFVPFSAGQRNCIGQKFAMLEMKVLLTALLRNFKLLPLTRMEDVIFEYGIVLRSQNNIKVKLEPRAEE